MPVMPMKAQIWPAKMKVSPVVSCSKYHSSASPTFLPPTRCLPPARREATRTFSVPAVTMAPTFMRCRWAII